MCTPGGSIPELLYFNAMANAEVTRQMFVIAGIEFKDTRLKDMEEWKQIKASGEISMFQYFSSMV